MVHIDVSRARALGKLSGDLSFEYPADDALIDVPFVAFSSPVSVTAHYEIGEDGKVEVTGTVRFKLKGLCSRCMKEAEHEILGEIDALFIPNGEDGEDYAYTNGRITLDEAVRDAVAFALPNSFLCGDDCEIPAFH
ncbi:MAG: DUF177 domain-containing protein [Clostridia bacterium]|nr:DUF177 domain-containing protein [Clostridia bacterium]